MLLHPNYEEAKGAERSVMPQRRRGARQYWTEASVADLVDPMLSDGEADLRMTLSARIAQLFAEQHQNRR